MRQTVCLEGVSSGYWTRPVTPVSGPLATAVRVRRPLRDHSQSKLDILNARRDDTGDRPCL